MNNRMKLLIKSGLPIVLMVYSLFAQAITTKEIKKETSQYVIDIKYPQGFKYAEVNTTIKEFIENTQDTFMNELSEDAKIPADAPGKTGLNITYSVPYNTNNALSIRFNVSVYHRGAAHPENKVIVTNFLNGHGITLADLFVKEADYLDPISRIANKEITAKKISDKQWIAEGTKPTNDNYSVWFFTNNGIAIIFNSYQVAAYVYGAQTVDIPFSAISKLIKPELAKVVWSA